MAKQIQLNGVERNQRDEAFRNALREVPAFTITETMPAVALQLRRVWGKFFPEMIAIFQESGYSI
jgi:hypothetical protein